MAHGPGMMLIIAARRARLIFSSEARAFRRSGEQGVVSASCRETMWNKTDSSLSFRPASS
jgi:hypothetical protein